MQPTIFRSPARPRWGSEIFSARPQNHRASLGQVDPSSAALASAVIQKVNTLDAFLSANPDLSRIVGLDVLVMELNAYMSQLSAIAAGGLYNPQLVQAANVKADRALAVMSNAVAGRTDVPKTEGDTVGLIVALALAGAIGYGAWTALK